MNYPCGGTAFYRHGLNVITKNVFRFLGISILCVGIVFIVNNNLSSNLIYTFNEALRGNPLSNTMDKVDWNANLEAVTKEKCQPNEQIFFLKIHKAGSSTMLNIIARYGIHHGLVFALPRNHNHVNRFAPVDISVFLPPPPGRNYDLLCCHAVYNRTVFRSLFPNTTRYLGILREPFEQFVSAFGYFNVYKRVGGSNPVRTFLSNPSRFPFPKAFNYIHNRMMFDFGLDPKDFFNEYKIKDIIKMVEQDFDLILILEYFAESMVLLRRRFCWTTKEILSLPLNQKGKRFPYHFTFEDYHLHKNYSKADHALYNHFLGVFWRQIFDYGTDFYQEVIFFRKVIKRVERFCHLEDLSEEQELTIPDSKWNSPFQVTFSDCKLMKTPEKEMWKIVRTMYANQINETLMNKH